jgi:hypothetical protein
VGTAFLRFLEQACMMVQSACMHDESFGELNQLGTGISQEKFGTL